MEALAVGHHRRGHEVTVAALVFQDSGAHPLLSSLTTAGVRVRVIRLTPRAYLRERREVAEVCRAVSPDVVHTHGYRTDLVDRGVAARLGIPTVTTVHGPSMTGGLKGAFYEWLQRRNYRRFDAVVAVSSALRETTLADGVGPHRLHCIPNAWGGLQNSLARSTARQQLGIDEDATVVGWVGRLIPVKGGDLFLEALSRLSDCQVTGVMIGYGPLAEHLQKLAGDLGIGARVRFYPHIRDAGRYFEAFDTYVLSSRSEGLPIVILEAMAAGTPIVAARVGGITDVLDESSAWLTPADDPAALANAINDSLRNTEHSAARVKRAAERLERDFGLDDWLDRYETVYRNVLRSPHGAATPA